MFGVQPTMSHQWKRALLEGASGVFERGNRKVAEVDEEQMKDLHVKIGELGVANDFLAKMIKFGDFRTLQTRPAHLEMVCSDCAPAIHVSRQSAFKRDRRNMRRIPAPHRLCFLCPSDDARSHTSAVMLIGNKLTTRRETSIFSLSCSPRISRR